MLFKEIIVVYTENHTKYIMQRYWPLKKMVHIYEISSSHGGEYEVQICLLGCTAM
jgi:hypothetical protein